MGTFAYLPTHLSSYLHWYAFKHLHSDVHVPGSATLSTCVLAYTIPILNKLQTCACTPAGPKQNRARLFLLLSPLVAAEQWVPGIYIHQHYLHYHREHMRVDVKSLHDSYLVCITYTAKESGSQICIQRVCVFNYICVHGTFLGAFNILQISTVVCTRVGKCACVFVS